MERPNHIATTDSIFESSNLIGQNFVVDFP